MLTVSQADGTCLHIDVCQAARDAEACWKIETRFEGVFNGVPRFQCVRTNKAKSPTAAKDPACSLKCAMNSDCAAPKGHYAVCERGQCAVFPMCQDDAT